MPLFEQPNLTSGIDTAIISTAQSVNIFPIMILFFIFGVTFLGGTANQKRRNGYADYPFWAVLSSLSTTFIALLFTMKTGLIDLATLGIIISITIMSGVWFFLSKVRGEI